MFLNTRSGSKRLESHDGTAAGEGTPAACAGASICGNVVDNLLEGWYWMVGEMMRSFLKVESCLK